MPLGHTFATIISSKTDVKYHSCLCYNCCYVIPSVALVTHQPWRGLKNTSAWSVYSREYRLSVCSFLKHSLIFISSIPRPVSKNSSKWQLVSVRKHQTFYCYFDPVRAHAYYCVACLWSYFICFGTVCGHFLSQVVLYRVLLCQRKLGNVHIRRRWFNFALAASHLQPVRLLSQMYALLSECQNTFRPKVSEHRLAKQIRCRQMFRAR
jgi:hypothetical protein